MKTQVDNYISGKKTYSTYYTPISGLKAFFNGLWELCGEITHKGHVDHFLKTMVNGFASVEKDDVPVEEVILEGSVKNMRTMRFLPERHFKATSDRDLLKQGDLGAFWGARVSLVRSGDEEKMKITFVGKE